MGDNTWGDRGPWTWESGERGGFEVAEELGRVTQVHSRFAESPPNSESLKEKPPLVLLGFSRWGRGCLDPHSPELRGAGGTMPPSRSEYTWHMCGHVGVSPT